MAEQLTENAAIIQLEHFAWQKNVKVSLTQTAVGWTVRMLSRDSLVVIGEESDKSLGVAVRAMLSNAMRYVEAHRESGAIVET